MGFTMNIGNVFLLIDLSYVISKYFDQSVECLGIFQIRKQSIIFCCK
jgi:hypothetical protein